MTVTIKQYKPSFYQTAVNWWKGNNWPSIPEKDLPTLGFVSFYDETPVAVAWLYQTDSAYCLLEWMVSNPEFREKETRGKAIDGLLHAMLDAASKLGFTKVFTSTRAGKYVSRLEAQGFAVTEKNMINLIAAV